MHIDENTLFFLNLWWGVGVNFIKKVLFLQLKILVSSLIRVRIYIVIISRDFFFVSPEKFEKRSWIVKPLR